jgi:hypothetical protein
MLMSMYLGDLAKNQRFVVPPWHERPLTPPVNRRGQDPFVVPDDAQTAEAAARGQVRLRGLLGSTMLRGITIMHFDVPDPGRSRITRHFFNMRSNTGVLRPFRGFMLDTAVRVLESWSNEAEGTFNMRVEPGEIYGVEAPMVAEGGSGIVRAVAERVSTCAPRTLQEAPYVALRPIDGNSGSNQLELLYDAGAKPVEVMDEAGRLSPLAEGDLVTLRLNGGPYDYKQTTLWHDHAVGAALLLDRPGQRVQSV